MKTAIIIPARYCSKRFDGKPLAKIKGATGLEKTLVQRAWEAASSVPNIAHLIVATDDQRIADHAASFGADVQMTSKQAKNGSERCAEVVGELPEDIDLIVNFQGDAPLTPPSFVTSLIEAMKHCQADMATPVLRFDKHTLGQFREDRKANRVGGTTAVFDDNNHALYFSKEVLPFSDELMTEPLPVFHHVGLYAFRPQVLLHYRQWPEGKLEQIEGLEQLRFLENGARVKCVEVDPAGAVFWEVNNPVDIGRVEAALMKMGVE